VTQHTSIRRAVPDVESEPGEETPLTERILSWLPGPRVLWLAVWVLVPWMNAAIMLVLQAASLIPTWDNTGVELLNRAAFSLAILLSVWGAGRITTGLRSLHSRLFELMGEVGDPMEVFRGMGTTAAPLMLTVVSGMVFGAQSAIQHGGFLRGLVTGGSWLLIGNALWTFVCVYLILQLGLHRLGRRRLSLQPASGDRSLGLRPLGTLAFSGFSTFVVAFVPLVLSGVSNRVGLTMGLLVLLVGVTAFFLSLRRLNRQMVAVKLQETAWAQRLYAEAFAPVREEGTLAALQRQSASLNAAEALEKRAERIQEWPFDEGMFARVVTITSTAAAAILARVLLVPFGI
jgi:hypothetical protein